jgi:hypothetical protein
LETITNLFPEVGEYTSKAFSIIDNMGGVEQAVARLKSITNISTISINNIGDIVSSIFGAYDHLRDPIFNLFDQNLPDIAPMGQSVATLLNQVRDVAGTLNL